MLSAVIPAALGYPAMLLAKQLAHHRCVHSGPLVLRVALINIPTPTSDRNQTVSRRFEPSSRTALMGEQPNPWNRLHSWCDEPTSRCQTFPSMWSLGKDKPVIPGVAFIRWATAFPRRTAGSLSPAFAPARLVGLTVNHTSTFMLLDTVSDRIECNFERLRYPLGGDRPNQTTHHTLCPLPG